MVRAIKQIILFISIISLSFPLYTQEGIKDTSKVPSAPLKPPSVVEVQKEEVTVLTSEEATSTSSFLNWINTKAYAASTNQEDEKTILRKGWEQMLGVDIFYPYFKGKEVEAWLKEKASIKLFDIKGKPEFDDDQIKYIFKVKF